MLKGIHARVDGGIARVWFGDHLHLRFFTEGLLGFRVWFDKVTQLWSLEIAFRREGTLTSEYDSFEKVMAVADALDDALAK